MKLDPNLMNMLPAILAQLKAAAKERLQDQQKNVEKAQEALTSMEEIARDLEVLATSPSASAQLTSAQLRETLLGLRDRFRSVSGAAAQSAILDDLLSDLAARLPADPIPVEEPTEAEAQNALSPEQPKE